MLSRFIQAQEFTYKVALNEIRNGRKERHWMWYIFPQIAGIGKSETSQYYAISGLKEAKEYLQHPVLGDRLREISGALLPLEGKSAVDIFDRTDARKLKACMTLFHLAAPEEPVFTQVLDKYFEGRFNWHTVRFLKESGEFVPISGESWRWEKSGKREEKAPGTDSAVSKECG